MNRARLIVYIVFAGMPFMVAAGIVEKMW